MTIGIGFTQCCICLEVFQFSLKKNKDYILNVPSQSLPFSMGKLAHIECIKRYEINE